MPSRKLQALSNCGGIATPPRASRTCARVPGPRQEKNRVVFASVYTGLARDGRVTPELRDFHPARARHGVAAIVLEPIGMWRGQTAHVQVQVHARRKKELSDSSGAAHGIYESSGKLVP